MRLSANCNTSSTSSCKLILLRIFPPKSLADTPLFVIVGLFSQDDCKMSAASRQNGRITDSSIVAPELVALFCKWKECRAEEGFCNVEELSKHVEEVHCHQNGIKNPTQMSYVCLWEGCRFYNLPNSSLSWLTRHVKIHTKSRPLKCLMNGCSSSFWTMSSLNKHLQLHFSESTNHVKGEGKKEVKEQRRTRSKAKRTFDTPVTPPKRWTRPIGVCVCVCVCVVCV